MSRDNNNDDDLRQVSGGFCYVGRHDRGALVWATFVGTGERRQFASRRRQKRRR